MNSIKSLFKSPEKGMLKTLLPKQSMYFSQDVLTGLVLIVLLLSTFVGWKIYQHIEEAQIVQSELEEFAFKIGSICEDNLNRKVLNRQLIQSDPRYIHHAIEMYLPFSSEVELYEDILSFSAFKGFKPLRRKLKKLQQGKGNLKLSPVYREEVKPFDESIYALKSSTFVNESDIKSLLARVEGRRIEQWIPLRGRPDLYFKKFTIEKNQEGKSREEYNLFFEILKRDRTS